MARRQRKQLGWQSFELGQETINGVDITISVSGDGRFSAAYAGDRLSDPTLDGLREKLRKAVVKGKTKVAVPFTLLNQRRYPGTDGGRYPWKARDPYWDHGIGVRHVTVTGKHGQNGDLLFVDADGEKGRGLEGRRWHPGDLGLVVARRLTPEEVEQYQTLATAKNVADEAYEAFVNKVRVEYPDTVVEEAMGLSVDTPDETDEEGEELADDPR